MYKTNVKSKTKISSERSHKNSGLKKTFSKGDTTNWSYILYKITEIIIDTIPSYRLDNLPERYNEAFLKKTELTMKENKDVMQALNVN